MAVVETVRHTGTVIHELHHVAAEVGLLVDAQSVGASVLTDKGRPTQAQSKMYRTQIKRDMLSNLPLESPDRSGCCC